jgi:hypothetical protein
LRKRPVPIFPRYDDSGRPLLLSLGFRLLGGVSPYLLFWLALLAAIPVLGWAAWEMHEAREAILNRIGSETFSVINLDHFLQATVTEVGKMMGVDRCDVMTLTQENQLRITHEYRPGPGDEVPSLLGSQLRVDLERLQEGFDLYSPQSIADTSSPDVPPILQKMIEGMGSKSVLLVPITFNLQLLGMMGLHHCREKYDWNEDEINFIRNLAQHIVKCDRPVVVIEIWPSHGRWMRRCHARRRSAGIRRCDGRRWRRPR